MARAATSRSANTAETPKRPARARKAKVEAVATPVVEPGPTKRQRTMSEDHKNALAAGRVEGRTVRLYLEALETSRPKRGRKRTVESVTKQLDEVESELVDAAPMQRLLLLQRRITLQGELEKLESPAGDLRELEGEFVRVARSYGERKGISYATWRAAGVSTAVLKQAGIARSV